ncbi:serine endopeptidase [Ramlibacter algicola]|uniref:Serine endopeptidase n=1 Tax=Ramlibacter algicola TaxID=2795217 RepID=A0A934UQ55_9BURK|nr:serine endopeptidase [Ramlibacter algicola]MBK0391192.1 serine endopeptidase [Ramlibacter algicola]
MGKGMRLSERWFRRGLWLVALVFAGFLVGLGNALVGDLPKVERTQVLDDFLDRPRAEQLRAQVRTSQRAQQDAQSALEQSRLQLQVARNDVGAARETFGHWLATRRATQQAAQDPELVERTRQLDALRQAERQAQGAVERQEQLQLDARQASTRAQRELAQLEEEARKAWAAEQRRVELRVFLYRLALTLPPLAVAGWLFRRHRNGTWWPFAWGFILFALFTFFVELVPYLPSYGGYVRYAVGIAVTVFAGRQAIRAYERYRDRMREAESRPEEERREEVPYDTALARMAKGACPGCERAVDLQAPGQDFCPHCGIGLFDRCGHCATRKNAFARYCVACGTAARGEPVPPAIAAPA